MGDPHYNLLRALKMLSGTRRWGGAPTLASRPPWLTSAQPSRTAGERVTGTGRWTHRFAFFTSVHKTKPDSQLLKLTNFQMHKDASVCYQSYKKANSYQVLLV
uniref:Uncharacterized protein n=1 Tax=Xiphophorus maculatus TaxID=8083 RepID=A0A3B5Q2K6_XIPMA